MPAARKRPLPAPRAGYAVDISVPQSEPRATGTSALLLAYLMPG